MWYTVKIYMQCNRTGLKLFINSNYASTVAFSVIRSPLLEYRKTCLAALECKYLKAVHWVKILFVPDVRLFQDGQKEEITPKRSQLITTKVRSSTLKQAGYSSRRSLCATEDTILMISIIFGQDHKNVAWSDESAAFEW